MFTDTAVDLIQRVYVTRPYKVKMVAHYALHGWDLVYGGMGTVGFYNHGTKQALGVYYRETLTDPNGRRIGMVTLLAQRFKAPVNLDDLPADIFEKLAKFTGVPVL